MTQSDGSRAFHAACRSEVRAGWPMVLAGFLATLVFSLPPYTTGIFMAPLQAAFGWSRSEISLSLSIFTLGMAFGAIGIGHVVTLSNARRLIAFGIAAFAAGYAVLSLMSGQITQLWTITGLIALFGAACSPVAVSRLIVHAFDRRRGTALGIAMVGSGTASAIAPLVLVSVVAQHGWRAGYELLSGTVLLVLIVVALLFVLSGKPVPRPADLPDDQVSTRQVSDGPFLRLLLGFFLVALAVGGAVVHFVPALTDAHLPRERIALLASLLGITVIVSRVVTGFAVDRLAASRVAATIMALGGVGFALLWSGSDTALPLVALVAGTCLGAELDLLAYLTSRSFPAAIYGRIYGYQFFAFQLGLAASPVIYALIREARGSYTPAFGLSAVALLISAILFYSLERNRPSSAAVD